MDAGLRLEVKTDVDQIRKAFAHLEPANFWKRVAIALNKTAAQARSEVSVEIPRVFDRPTPYTMSATRIIGANTQNQRAEVTLKNANPGASISQHKYLGAEIAGGTRRDKRSELRLRAAGLLPNGWQTAPGPAAKLDVYGNLNRSDVMQILSYLQTFGGRSAKLNLSAEKRAKRAKGTRRKSGYELFVSMPGEHWPSGRPRTPGVWRRTFLAAGTAVDLLLTYIRPPAYKPRLQFQETVDRVVKRDFSSNLADAFSKASTS